MTLQKTFAHILALRNVKKMGHFATVFKSYIQQVKFLKIRIFLQETGRTWSWRSFKATEESTPPDSNTATSSLVSLDSSRILSLLRTLPSDDSVIFDWSFTFCDFNLSISHDTCFWISATMLYNPFSLPTGKRMLRPHSRDNVSGERVITDEQRWFSRPYICST